MSEETNNTVNVWIDGNTYEATPGENLLQAVLDQKLDLPYFCWHPSLGSVGACRQCAVMVYADEEDERGRLTMACMTPVTEGLRVSVEAAHAAEFRESVIEWLMENHPHDCPVCEEGGECHLQDMTVMTGHSARRYRGNKRTFNNQYLGPFINHEMNRCITCYRCVRYYRDYAGGTDLQAFGSRARMYFGREQDGVLENPFAGNLVEVCPTGVFTDKPFSSSYTRKWDLRSAPGICMGCSVGCNTFPAERYGRLKRITNRYHGEINGYFLCDRGRFGSGFVNEETRIRHPGRRAEDGVFEMVAVDESLQEISSLLSAGGVLGIGSPRASLESNFALRELVGVDNFSCGLGAGEARATLRTLEVYDAGAGQIASLSDVEQADAVLVLGEDVLNTAPRAALSIRQAVRNEALQMAEDAGIPTWQAAGVKDHAQGHKNPLFLVTNLPTGLDDISRGCLQGDSHRIAAIGHTIAHGIDERFPDGGIDDALIEDVVNTLTSAERPLIVSGTSQESAAIVEAAGHITAALSACDKAPSLLLSGMEVNSYGAALLGGCDVDVALGRAAEGKVKTLVVLENDLFRRAEPALVEQALEAIENLIVIDVIDGATADRADWVMPAASFAESTGTFVNYETRAQRSYEVFLPADEIRPAWEWLAAFGRMKWETVDDVSAAIAGLPQFAAVSEVAPSADYRTTAHMKVPRQPHRASGRTAMTADVSVHEPKTAIDEDTPLSFSMEGYNRNQPGGLVPYVWSPGWNSNQSVFKFQQEVAGPLTGGDPGVRLVEPAGKNTDPVYDVQPVQSEAAGIRLFPAFSVFASDELAVRSPAVRERAGYASVVLSAADAEVLGVSSGDGVRCDVLDVALEVEIEDGVSQGCAYVKWGGEGVNRRLPADSVELRHDPGYQKPVPTVIARG